MWRLLQLLILTVERQTAVSPPCVWVQGEDTDSQWAASWPRQPTTKNCSHLLPEKTTFSLLIFLCLLLLFLSFSAHSRSPTLSLWLYMKKWLVITLLWDFFEKRKKKQSWISSIARRKKRFLKKDGYFFLPSLFLRHTPMFSFAAQGGEQELARQQGWVSCNWNWCKGLRVVLFSLPDNSSLLHTHTFSRLQMTEMSDCQSVATPWGHPSYL